MKTSRSRRTSRKKSCPPPLTHSSRRGFRAQKQQLYIETLVAPNVPDQALEPKRVRGILAVFVLGMFLWGIFSVIIAGVKEHHDR